MKQSEITRLYGENFFILQFQSRFGIILVMDKLTHKLTKLRSDLSLHHYLKNHPEVARGMTVKEVNGLIDSLSADTLPTEPILPGANKPQRSYQEVLASVKSWRVENTNAKGGREI